MLARPEGVGERRPVIIAITLAAKTRDGNVAIFPALMHRAFDVDVLACPRWGGRLRLIATVEDPGLVRAILAYPVSRAPPRPPLSARPCIRGHGPWMPPKRRLWWAPMRSCPAPASREGPWSFGRSPLIPDRYEPKAREVNEAGFRLRCPPRPEPGGHQDDLRDLG
jgi:hypothetical protein